MPDIQLRPSIQDRLISYMVCTRIYPLPALFRACYWFTDSCFIYFSPGPDDETVLLRITPKDESRDPQLIAGEFFNSLLDHTLRYQIAQETAPLRALLYAQAFAEVEDSVAT
jgi:His-Xaa-Ser system protein HxsD